MNQLIFNYVIMLMYLINAIWWGVKLKWADSLYWVFAFGITACVTWGYKR